MTEKRANRNFYILGQGSETAVHAYQREGIESKTVLKGYETIFRPEGGFDSVMRDRLTEHYTKLRNRYGHLIPRQRFLRLGNNDYTLVQERVEVASPGNIFMYEPGSDRIQKNTREQLQCLADILKDNYEQYKITHSTTATNIPLDFVGKANLLVNTRGDLKYIDTSHVDPFGVYAFENLGPAIIEKYLIPVMQLELIGGRNYQEVIDQPVFAELRAYLQKKNLISTKQPLTNREWFNIVQSYASH